MSSTPSSVALDDSAEYHRRFNLLEDVEILVSAAKGVVEENAVLLRSSKSRGRLDYLLLALLDHAPCDNGKRYVAIVIQMAQEKGPQEVVRVADAWERYLCVKMLTLAIRSGLAPTSSQTPTTLDETLSEIEKANRAQQSKLRTLVSERERHRCAVSGEYDVDYYQGRKADLALVTQLPDDSTFNTMQAAHIFPLSLNDFDENTHDKAALSWDMLRAWTGRNFKELIGKAINTPANCIYMTQGLHGNFGKFRFYFDKEPFPDVPNKYQATGITSTMRLFNGKTKKEVQFHTSDENGHPIAAPNPWFLKIHAALARVLYACGAAEYFEAVERDADSYGTLQANGETDIELLLEARLVAAR